MGKVFLFLLMAAPSFALQVHPLVDQQHLSIDIAKEGLNRIAVSGDRIHQVFGQEGTFELQSDEGSGQIFVRAESGKPFTLTLITESGLTQDLTLNPTHKTFQSIVLKPHGPEETTKKRPLTERLTNLIKRMRQHQKAHTDEELEGLVFRVRNKGDDPITLEESKLASPEGLALSLSKRSVPSGESALLFVIRRRA